MPNKNNDHQLRATVREQYGKIASTTGASCCAGGGCCTSSMSNAEALAKSIGYSSASLDDLPQGSNMGLSCGNPLAITSLQEGEIVLDLGSGGGFDVFQAGKMVGKAGRVIGVDMTAEMLSLARKNTVFYEKNTGLANVEFRLGEIENLPVADSSIDVVLSNCVINLSPDKPRVWSEIYRVLKKGGRIAISDLALLLPLPDSIVSSTAALVGCVAGASLVQEIQETLQELGFKQISLTPKKGYVQQMVAMNDGLYKEIVEALPQGKSLSDYIVNLDIAAEK